MTTMHPHYEDADIERMITGPGAPGEIKLYRELRDQLPEKWDVLYDNRIHAGGNDVQTDFLVFRPGKGVVNIDAKGGGYRFVDNNWYLGDQPDDIFYKADRAIRTFNDYVKKHITGSPWGAFGRLVVFLGDPVDRDGRPVTCIPGDYHYMLRKDVDDKKLQERIERELDEHPEAHRFFTKEVYDKILKHFCYKICFMPRSDEFEGYDRTLKPVLTAAQNGVMKAIEKHELVHVSGGAGTGKTVLATACAGKFASRGERVMYVCYNKCLADYIRELLEEQGLGNVAVTHFDAIPGNVFDVPGPLLPEDQSATNDWEKFHNEVADTIISRGGDLSDRDKFDLILIDEAQDMNTNMLWAFLYLIKEKGRIAFFSDSAQSIFRGGWEFPAKDFVGLNEQYLDTNMRNTDNIHNRIVGYSHETTRPGGLIMGGPPKEFSGSVADLVANLLTEGIRPHSIAVLAYRKKTIDGLQSDEARDVRFTEKFRFWNKRNGNVLKATVQSFKGLEADVVIVADSVPELPELTDTDRDHLRYVAESRAKYRLYLHKDR